MGWKLSRVEVCKLEPNEEKDLCIVLKEEKRAAIHGEVKFPWGKPVEGAIVKLFKVKEKKDSKDCKDGYAECDLEPITFAFTDECGQFLFGVDSYVEYVIKVFFYEPECPKDKEKCDEK